MIDGLLTTEMVHIASLTAEKHTGSRRLAYLPRTGGSARGWSKNSRRKDLGRYGWMACPKRLPEGGDHVLDHTQTWGRHVLGRAMLSYAEVEIRRANTTKRVRGCYARDLEPNGDIQTEADLTTDRPATQAMASPSITDRYNEWRGKPVTHD